MMQWSVYLQQLWDVLIHVYPSINLENIFLLLVNDVLLMSEEDFSLKMSPVGTVSILIFFWSYKRTLNYRLGTNFTLKEWMFHIGPKIFLELVNEVCLVIHVSDICRNCEHFNILSKLKSERSTISSNNNNSIGMH